MAHVKGNRKPLLARISRIQGQLESLREKVADDGADCGAVLQQIAAVRGAVNGLMAEVLAGHLHRHLVPARGAGKDEVEQVVKVLRSYLK